MARFVASLLAAGALLAVGCSSTQTAEVQTTATTPGGPVRIGAGDEIGWSLYNADRALAAQSDSGTDFASH
jgi:hypothetical protein